MHYSYLFRLWCGQLDLQVVLLHFGRNSHRIYDLLHVFFSTVSGYQIGLVFPELSGHNV